MKVYKFVDCSSIFQLVDIMYDVIEFNHAIHLFLISASNTFMAGEPMNCATNTFSGKSYTSFGEPTCMISP